MAHTHGIQWTDELIEEKLNEIVIKRNMNTFPTHSELQKYTGNQSLSNAISKHGGSKYWAKKLNLQIKSSESKFGEKFELLAIEKLKILGYQAYQTTPCFPYDILVNKNIKIDVKVSKIHSQKNKGYEKIHNFYSFNLSKKEPTCDIYVCYCVNDNDEILKTLIIPSCNTSGLVTLNINTNSKWNVYVDNWSCIKEYDRFYEEQKNKYV